MGRAVLVCAITLAGCGRLAFDPLDGSGGTSGDDAAADGFCASITPAPTRCADFDDAQTDGDLASGFTRERTQDAGGPIGTIRIVGGLSLPNAFASTTPPLAPAEIGVATLGWDLPSSTTRLHYRGAFFLPVRPSTPRMEILSVNLRLPTGDAYDAEIAISSGTGNDSYVEEYDRASSPGIFQQSVPIPDVPIAKWVAFDWSIDFAARTYSLTLDNEVIADSIATAFMTAPGLVTVQLGINHANGPSEGHTIYVDNVIVDAE